jgi:NAD-dependent histone deacetylase SIR2
VLYDEPHPLGEDIGLLAAADCARKPGALVVMGTSLKVHGLKALVRDFARGARAAARPGKVIFVNRTPPPAEWAGVFDYWVCGETDEWCSRVEADWRRLRPQDWEIQQTLDGPGPSVGLKAQKATVVAATKKSKGLCAPCHARHAKLTIFQRRLTSSHCAIQALQLMTTSPTRRTRSRPSDLPCSQRRRSPLRARHRSRRCRCRHPRR